MFPATLRESGIPTSIVIVALLSGYILAFLLLGSRYSFGVMGLSPLPLVITPMRTNLKVGLLFGFFLVPLNMTLVTAAGGDWTARLGTWAPGSVVLILAGGIIGSLRELTRKLEANKAELKKNQAAAAKSRRLSLVYEGEGNHS